MSQSLRGAFLAGAAAAVALAGAVVLKSEPSPPRAPRCDAGCICGDVDAGLVAGGLAPGAPSALPTLVATAEAPLAVPALGAFAAPSGESTTDAGIDGVLPPGSPKRVRFGVVVIAYQGAEDAPRGAPSKDAARAKAEAVVADATADFPAAVRKGDPGSSENLGQISRGILERGLEYAIFTTPVGRVTGPLESPRGFWVVKRIE